MRRVAAAPVSPSAARTVAAALAALTTLRGRLGLRLRLRRGTVAAATPATTTRRRSLGRRLRRLGRGLRAATATAAATPATLRGCLSGGRR